MAEPRYRELARHYESCFERHGPGHLGVDWPDEHDAAVRYGVMLDVVRPLDDDVSLLDFGCGDGALLQHLRRTDSGRIRYAGHDISEIYVEHCRQRFPDVRFTCGDILDGADLPEVDYIVANGVFTERLTLSYEEMFDFMRQVVNKLFEVCRRGVAFNTMSTDVDWQRDDLFHVPVGEMASLVSGLSRHYALRQDYGLYEYTTYVYK